ncbi:MAG: RsmD family RNA methyltransferase [Synergistaceae bacterium]|jgi:16S rRNA (guanine(966)-N(2))-methyltransferase RsmD|nr:RsmD family RNA methyltransferase [Synergistaceae bacterium]
MKLSRGNVRPTTGKVLGALFNILGASGDIAGARFLDLFSGTGQVALEALRRGASSVVAVESSRAEARLIMSRLREVCGESEAVCVNADARRAIPSLAKEGRAFSVIFADPPYGMGWGESLPLLIARHDVILAPGGLFILERSIRDSAAGPDSSGGVFTGRDDRIYGDTVLSIYRKIRTGE